MTVDSEYANVENFYGYRAENQVSAALRTRIATALGYDPLAVASVPEDANIGEGCGNPLLIANLAEVSQHLLSYIFTPHLSKLTRHVGQQGETVVDLGSGGGFDCFLAAQKVGKNGKVIGIDMTEVPKSNPTSHPRPAIKNRRRSDPRCPLPRK